MKAIILSIGDELLNGQTVNTNATWMSVELNQIGIDVVRVITLSDKREDIVDTLDYSLKKADIILFTGGLGPTSDDVTRNVLCDYFDSKLIFNERVFEDIKKLFNHRKRAITEETKDLAMVAENAEVLYNSMGTAPGMLFKKNDKIVVSMPGVPYEMKAMMKEQVFPYFHENLDLPIIIHRFYKTAAIGESLLSKELINFEKELPSHISLAYLPSVGTVRLRLSARGDDRAQLKSDLAIQEHKIMSSIGKYVYGFDEETLSESLGKLLIEKKLQLVTAESCTGGYISHVVTKTSGSSSYYKGSIIAYSNDVKKSELNVQEETLAEYGAVSEQTVQEMIDGVLSKLAGDVAIAVSGIAGPSGGTKEKPVGTVVIGVGDSKEKYIRTVTFTTNRLKNIELTAVVALVMLRKFIIKRFA